MQVTVNGQSIRVPGCAGAFYSGSAGIYSLSFEFSPDWDGWGKTAVFQAEAGDPIEVPIVGGACVVPWEVLQSPGRVKVGVYGVRGDDTMPTAWADSLIVRKGTPTGTPSQPPTPDVYELILESMEKKLDKDQGVASVGLYLRVGADGEVIPADGVASVNGQVGDVTLTAADVGALPDDTVIPVPPVDSVNGKTGTVVLTASDVGALPDDTIIPTPPVDSVNGKTGAVVLSASDVGALPDDTVIPVPPVSSVNTKTGAVVLTASDVGALPDSTVIPTPPVDSVNGKTGAVTLSASDVGALPDDTVIPPAPVEMIGALPYDDGEAGYVPAPRAGEEERFLKGDGTWADAPVMTVNGKTGEVELSASDVGALPDSTIIPTPPVDSVNGKTGAVVLSASDVGALPDSTVIPVPPVTSVNTKTGAVTLTASDVGALPSSTSIPTVTSDLVNDSGFISRDDAAVLIELIPGANNTFTTDKSFAEIYAQFASAEKAWFLLPKSMTDVIVLTPTQVDAGAYTIRLTGEDGTDTVHAELVGASIGAPMTGSYSTFPTEPDASDVGALPDTTLYAGAAAAGGAADKAVSIPFGQVDGTSTSTAYTATIAGITELRDGVCVFLRNGIVDSASGCTLDINNLGAKPIYQTMTASTAVSTTFKSAYTMLFVYNSARVAGGCWDMYYGYNANDNTIGYQLRTNSMSLPVSGATYRYRILFTSADGSQFVPATTSTSTNATSSRTVNQTKIDPHGTIRYYSYTTAVSAGSRPGATYLWTQYVVTLGYSFNRTGAALVLTSWKPVYIKCAPQADGSAIIDADTPYVQTLPATADGKIYIFLGVAVSATTVEMVPEHPVYCYRNGGIQRWTGAQAEIDALAARLDALVDADEEEY